MKEETKKKISEASKKWWREHPNYRGVNAGKKMSEETKEKMRQAKLGKKRKSFTEEHKAKLRKILDMGRIKVIKRNTLPDRYCIDCGVLINRANKNERCGDCNREYLKDYRKKNNLYKSREYHLIRESNQFKNWRNQVFKRDNYTCKKCGSAGVELHPHHILNFSKHKDKRFDVFNGITLCVKCHKEFHKVYGIRNNNEEQIKEYLCLV